MKNDYTKSTMNKKLWWSKLKFSLIPSKTGKCGKDDGDDEDALSRKLNVNEEYKEVFRTKSYTEIWSKVQCQLKFDHNNKFSSTSSSSCPCPSPSQPSSSSNNCSTSSPLVFYTHLSDSLLEPHQEAVNDIIKSSNLRSLLINYFEASLEACNICELLLEGIHKTRYNHQFIERVIKLSLGNNYMNDQQCQEMVIQHLDSFTRLRNPILTIINEKMDFNDIHDKYAGLLQKLTSRRRKIKQRKKFTRFYKKAASYGFIIAYTALAITMLALAMHSVVGLLGLPGLIVAFPSWMMKKASNGSGIRASFLKRLASQLDVAARGVYTLINDFDTVGRLVKRLYDEVEHTRSLAKICVRNRKRQEVVKEALRELHLHEKEFVEQLEELEEHIYLCFLTINRSRRLVIQEILTP